MWGLASTARTSSYDSGMPAVVLDASGRPASPTSRSRRAPANTSPSAPAGSAGRMCRKSDGRRPGTVLGQEVVAEDAEGRRVALVHHLPCGECARCRAGHETTCERFPEPMIVPGGFAERARASETIPLPDEVDDATGTFAEPLACVLRAVERVPQGRVLVVGCGFAGLLFVQALVRRGDDVTRQIRSRTGSSWRSAAAPSRRTGRWTPPSSARTPGSRARSQPSSQAGRCSSSPGWSTRRRWTSSDPAPGADAGRLLLGDYGRDARSDRAPPGLDPIPTMTMPLARFAEGLDLYRPHEAVKVVYTP